MGELKMAVCISTGSFFKAGFNTNQAIKRIRELKQHISVDGVELVFPSFESLFDEVIEKDNIEFLKSLKENSIHMPFGKRSGLPNLNRIVSYDSSETVAKAVEKTNELIKEFSIKKLVFHPQDIKSTKILSKLNALLTVENMNGKKWKKCNTVKETKDFLEEHKIFNLTFDPTHALRANVLPQNFLTLKNKIKAIQLGCWENGKHVLLKDLSMQKVNELFSQFKKLDCDYIVEEDFGPEENEDLAELKFIENYFF